MNTKATLISRTGGVALIVWMDLHTRLAQSIPPKPPGTFTAKVDCNKKRSINSTLVMLTKAGMTRGATIVVTGACKEDVLIQGQGRQARMQ